MALTGTSTSISLRKSDLTSDRFSGTYRKVQFAHKATGGESGINLSSLTTPSSEMPGFVQATAAEISAAQLFFNQKNLTLISSVRGVLAPFMSYQVASSTQINFTDSFGTALAGEVFIGIIESTDKGASALPATSTIVTSGTLTANTQDFAVNGTFTTNKNPTQQIGEVLVFLDGQLQYRNTGNAAASPSADGNYHELDVGTGLSSTIRFNVVDPVNDRAVVVVSNGMLVEQPSGSMKAAIETLAGQQDLVIQTLAEVAGVPTSNFYATPNSVDQLSYANMVQTLNNNAALKNASNTWTVAQNLPGRTDGAAVSAGVIGETLFNEQVVGPTAASVSGTPFNIGSISLTAGVWIVYAQGTLIPGTATGNTYLAIDINTVSATQRDASNLTRLGQLTSTGNSALGCLPLVVRVSSSQTVYAVGAYNFSAVGTSAMRAVMTAVRIA